MEPSLPVARALAIAGEVVAGGVGVHETALPRREVRLEGARSLEEAVARVAEVAPSVPEGRWRGGSGGRGGEWSPPVEPTKEALDRVTGDTPAALMAKDYHSLWLNSAALARANGQLQVPGGVVEVDERGEPTGVLREECAWHFRDSYAAPSDDESVDAMRVWQSLPHEQVAELARLGLRSGFGNPLLRIGYLKAFMDGTLGSQTARMLDGSGVEITSREGLEDFVRRGVAAGFPVAVHAIGDLANREALDAFEATRDLWAPAGFRPRIEHAQLLTPEDVPRFARLGVAASVQFSHAPSDRDLADRFWAGKTDGAYAYRSLLESGAVLANGSDAPIEELDPWAGVCAGVLRTIDDRPAWHPEQTVTLEQALEATILAPAWLAGDERRRGKLVPGFLADLVVLDRDPFELEPEELPTVRVVATMVGGRWM